MIIGKIHPGSGLGDQLFTYITTRTIALDHGYDFGFVGKEFFKGKDLMNLDWGKEPGLPYIIEHPAGKLMTEQTAFEINKPYYDPEVNFIKDGTVIDATGAQDERYWGHRLNEIREWLKTESLETQQDVCVINFRGGEYSVYPDLFLTQEYWDEAIRLMRQINPNMRFDVHTDDPFTAQKFFPEFNIWDNQMATSDKQYTRMAFNWRNIRYAKYLILANSAFGILPALLNENVEKVIAPRYWARRNIKQWSTPQNYYSKFTYV